MTDTLHRPVPTDTPDAATAADDVAQDASLYERLGGVYGISGAVDMLVDRLYDNAAANVNEHVAAFHAMKGHAGFKFLVTAWSIEKCGGPACYPGREMGPAHASLYVTDADFDIVATEIAATLYGVGVPLREHREFMAIIESYRDQVVSTGTDPGLDPEATA